MGDDIALLSASLDGDEPESLQIDDGFGGPFRPVLAPNDFVVATGIDEDGDGLEQSEVSAVSDDCLRIVSTKAYERAVLLLVGASNCLSNPDLCEPVGLFRPISGAFLRTFLNLKTGDVLSLGPVEPQDAVVVGGRAGCVREDDRCLHPLSHNVGVAFGQAGEGLIRDFRFSTDSTESGLASKVRGSAAMRDKIVEALRRNKALVRSLAHLFCPLDGSDCPIDQMFPLDSAIDFTALDDLRDKGLAVDEVDRDLDTAVGGALLQGEVSVTVAQTSQQLLLSSVRITGRLLDLYDFAWGDRPRFPRIAAIAQAGFKSLGTAGEVFSWSVELDGVVLDIDFDVNE